MQQPNGECRPEVNTIPYKICFFGIVDWLAGRGVGIGRYFINSAISGKQNKVELSE